MSGLPEREGVLAGEVLERDQHRAGDEEVGDRPAARTLDLTVEVDEGSAQPLRNIGAEP